MIHGWLNIDKPVGISSARVVSQVKRIFNIKKAGHLGTLDPLASGVLPIALSEATKTIPYLNFHLKAYEFTVKWGEQRITDDSNGEVVKSSSIKPDFDQINCAMKNFIGEIMQAPPEFSALKINGVRAYKLARGGQKVNIKPRLIQVHELKLVSMDYVNNSTNFSMVCGSGVYVRSIARDLGIALNCFGHVTQLRRTMVGDFKQDDALTIDQLTEKTKIISVASILQTIPKVEVSAEEGRKVKNGQEIILNNLYDLENYDICYAVVGDLPIAICNFIYGYIRPIRVFNI